MEDIEFWRYGCAPLPKASPQNIPSFSVNSGISKRYRATLLRKTIDSRKICMYINKVDLVGRAGQDPEVRYFESGAMKVSLSLAVKPPYKSENPLWFDLELWGNIAQVAADWVLQGSTVAVTGELVLDKWTDKTTGELREKPIVKVSNLELISSSRKSTESSSNTEVENY